MRSPPIRMKDDTKTKTEKRNQKACKDKEFQHITHPRPEKEKNRSALLCVLFWSHVINSLSHCQGIPDSIKSTHRAHFCAKGARGLHCVCIYIEHIPATCIPWSWNTAEIPLPTHTPKVCVCVLPFHSASSCESYYTACIATEKDLVSV